MEIEFTTLQVKIILTSPTAVEGTSLWNFLNKDNALVEHLSTNLHVTQRAPWLFSLNKPETLCLKKDHFLREKNISLHNWLVN